MKILPQFQLTTRLRHGWLSLLEGATSAMQVLVPGGGAAICFAVGKVVIGLILAAFTLAVVMRLIWRRKHADRVIANRKLPVGAKVLSFFGAMVGSALLVEAPRLPVRFDQHGFSMMNWLVVVVAIWCIHQGILWLFRAWLERQSTAVSLVEKQ
jgi:amino acid transporter